MKIGKDFQLGIIAAAKVTCCCWEQIHYRYSLVVKGVNNISQSDGQQFDEYNILFKCYKHPALKKAF